MNDRQIHSAEHQGGMITPKHRPGCYVEDPAKVTPRGVVSEGHAGGVAPGPRNPFHDQGRSCGNASSPAVWAEALRHTPTCAGCQRAFRALALCAGTATP